TRHIQHRAVSQSWFTVAVGTCRSADAIDSRRYEFLSSDSHQRGAVTSPDRLVNPPPNTRVQVEHTSAEKPEDATVADSGKTWHLANIATRHPDVVPSSRNLQCQLCSSVASSHHQHITIGQLSRILILTRMNLHYRGIKVGRPGRCAPLLIRTGGDHYLLGFKMLS